MHMKQASDFVKFCKFLRLLHACLNRVQNRLTFPSGSSTRITVPGSNIFALLIPIKLAATVPKLVQMSCTVRRCLLKNITSSISFSIKWVICIQTAIYVLGLYVEEKEGKKSQLGCCSLGIAVVVH